MERSRMHGLAHNRRRPIPMMTFVTRFAPLLVAMASFPDAGLAQSNLPPQTDSRGTSPTLPNTQPIETQGRMQAPVGHRQPRVQTCRQTSCERRAAKAGASTPRWSWTRNWEFAKAADAHATPPSLVCCDAQLLPWTVASGQSPASLGCPSMARRITSRICAFDRNRS
jgi:hypothetical protein